MKSEALLSFEQRLAGTRVLVTGNTGFTGSWLCMWLQAIGAEVRGLALPPATEPSLHEALGLGRRMTTDIVDIRDCGLTVATIKSAAPEIVLHLAAQPLVRRSYREPIETFATNVLGTAHVLEGARAAGCKAVLVVTTDKVYENREWLWPYRETDRLGGKDPYSASKAAAEIVAQSYRASFGKPNGPAIATARGGNIIGGGDWSEDRIVPDFVRACRDGVPLVLRNPAAVRPWQHVLALCHGYLMIAADLLAPSAPAATAWNLGPEAGDLATVEHLVEELARCWQRPQIHIEGSALAEAQMLMLDSSLARKHLSWRPPWAFRETVARTAAWYQAFYEDPLSALATTAGQIDDYRAALLAAVATCKT